MPAARECSGLRVVAVCGTRYNPSGGPVHRRNAAILLQFSPGALTANPTHRNTNDSSHKYFHCIAVLLGVAGLLVAIATATVTTVWLLWQVRQEQLTVAELLRGGSISSGALEGQRPIGLHWLAELRWEFVFSVFVLLVLLATAIAVVVMLRAYLVSERRWPE